MISPNQTFLHNDEAPISCNDCKGCSTCCTDMGDTIILDPYDMYMLTTTLKLAGGHPVTYDILTSEDGPLALTNVDGIILPHLKMVVDEDAPADAIGTCAFLNAQGRCSIHKIRTGLCRLYPLGRTYHEDSISYFILDETLGCPAKEKSNVTIGAWLGIPEMEHYEQFLLTWHNIKKSLQIAISEGFSDGSMTMQTASKILSRFLAIFYQKPFEQDFYSDFDKRVSLWQSAQ